MKKIEAIIRPEAMDEVKRALVKLEINGMHVENVAGHGHQGGVQRDGRGGQPYRVDMLPKVKLTIVVSTQGLGRQGAGRNPDQRAHRQHRRRQNLRLRRRGRHPRPHRRTRPRRPLSGSAPLPTSSPTPIHPSPSQGGGQVGGGRQRAAATERAPPLVVRAPITHAAPSVIPAHLRKERRPRP